MALKRVRPIFSLLLLAGPDLPSQTFQEQLRRGLLALQRNDLISAEANLQSAALLQPRNARVWVALSQTFWKHNEPAKAEEAAEKASTFAGNDSAVLQSLVIYYSESGQRFKAADAQSRYSAANPSNSAARDRAVALYFEAVRPLLQAERFGDVVTSLHAAPASIANSAQIQLVMGVAYYGLRRFEEAATAFLSVIAVDPSIKQPYLFLGKMLDQIPSRLNEVTERFIAYERENPSDFEGYLLHAKVLDTKAVEPETARKLLEKVISIAPGSAEAHFELGSLLDRTQHFSDAVVEFQTAARLDPSDAATHYRLSRLYERLNKPEAALAEREQHRKMVTEQNTAR